MSISSTSRTGCGTSEEASGGADRPVMKPGFTIQPETPHELLSDGSEGAPKRLASFGGLKGFAAHLKTDLARGVDATGAAALAERREVVSINELPEAEERTLLEMVLESLEDRMVHILIVSAVVSLVLGLTVPDPATGAVEYRHGSIEGAAIRLSVAVVTLVSSVNSYWKEQKFRELSKATPPVKARVIGTGATVEITDRELLSGDILTVSGGDVLTVDGIALEGPQLRELARSAQKLSAILPRLQVISRASPLDRRILVSVLTERGEVVAVTGDGTNDAPALNGADVGFLMDSDTEVAKLASDVVILDDNSSTIVTAMKRGRSVKDHISKYLQFQVTVNVAAVVVCFFGALLDGNGESPLKRVQLLWLNLIMDTFAALAFATETPSNEVLLRPRRPKAAPLITQRMWVTIGGQSAYQILLQLWLIHCGAGCFGLVTDSEEHLTVVFNAFVLLQLCSEFDTRILGNVVFAWHNIRHAPMFLAVVGATFVIPILAVQYGGALMRCVPLTAELWGECLLFAVVPLPLGVVLRSLHIGARAVRPPPVIDDEAEEAEEAALTLAAKPRVRPTLKKAAAEVCTQLRVVEAFRSTVQARKKTRAAW